MVLVPTVPAVTMVNTIAMMYRSTNRPMTMVPIRLMMPRTRAVREACSAPTTSP